MKIADYEDALQFEKVTKLKRLRNLITYIESIPANELVEKWDTEASQLWQKGFNYSNADGSSVELGNRANRRELADIELRMEVA